MGKGRIIGFGLMGVGGSRAQGEPAALTSVAFFTDDAHH